jgi:glycosyltransferase involved in cell wall biosynthesis
MKQIGIDARFFTERATGVGRHVYELIQQLSKLDSTNHYTVFLKESEFNRFVPPAHNFSKALTTAPHYSLSEQITFLKQLNNYQFDLMVFPQFNAPILYKRPFVVTIHDLTLHKFPGKKKTNLIARLAYKVVINIITKRAKHCFAVSKNTKQDMIKILGLPANKITVSYNGVTPKFKPIKTNSSFNKKHKLPSDYFLYTGVSRSHKNLVGLIKAYEKFLKKQKSSSPPLRKDSEIHLVLAGPIDPTYDEIDFVIKKLKLENKVHRLGLFPEQHMNELYNAAIAYVFPSYYEGFGLPPLEAMQCGIPVACSNTSSLPEVCGQAVIYFDPYKTDSMSQALEAVAFNQTKRKQCIKQGFIQCQKFTWEEMVQKMFKVYQNILNCV